MSGESAENNLDFIKKIAEKMDEDDIQYFYRGLFTHNIVMDILNLIEKNLLRNKTTDKVKKKIYNLMVECLQNITRHQAITDDKNINNSGFVAIQYTKDRYLISTANVIKNEHIETVKNKIEHVNSLDKAGLKSFYKKQLIQGDISDQGGAGLGFIDMARKSNNTLGYKFFPISEEVSYFYFRLEIIAKEEIPENYIPLQQKYNLDYLEQIHALTNKYNLSLIYNDILNYERTDNLIAHLKKQFSDTNKDKNEVYEIIFEMLNALVKFAFKEIEQESQKPAIFFLDESDKQLKLNSGSTLNEHKITNYKKHLQAIDKYISDSDLSNNELTDKEKETFSKLRNMSYKFLPINDSTYFLAIQMCI